MDTTLPTKKSRHMGMGFLFSPFFLSRGSPEILCFQKRIGALYVKKRIDFANRVQSVSNSKSPLSGYV